MKNLHIEHPEDSILTGDLTVLDWFTADSNISVKIDGAPAIVWGTNPSTGNFFVGTKSVFNKVKIKINESHQQIDKNHTGKVAEILHNCLDYLPRTDNIYQGDFIGFGGNNTYCPNTITYKFPEIVYQRLIVAPHTYYIANKDLRDCIAFPLTSKMNNTSHVRFVQPNVELSVHLDDIKDACNFARQMSTLCAFLNVREAQEVKKAINTYIREGYEIDEDEIAESFQVDVNVLRLWKLVESIKMDMFCYIFADYTITCEIEDKDVDHEGYVIDNEFGTFKVVDRFTFSYHNFNIAKNW
tara:strand:+ start:471 stop:1364 length:894 start_codon:yes stop_codon:yes gene_type:complete